jgi:hypothetical protein
MITDLRYAIRQLIKAPGFTLLAVLTLALGIGMNTAIFSVVHALLLDPFPYRDHARLVQLRQQKPTDSAVQMQHTGREFGSYQEQARSFEALAAIENVSRNLTVANEQPERVAGEKVTADSSRCSACRRGWAGRFSRTSRARARRAWSCLDMMSGKAGSAETPRQSAERWSSTPSPTPSWA